MDFHYSSHLSNCVDLFELYDSVDWNSYLQLSKEDLEKAVVQSWYVINAYEKEKLIGTGRVISDGVINACICGIVVHPSYQKQGIGTEIVQKLVEKCREGNLHSHVNQFE
ncbi:GNAT family N-acetyltransferase [Paenibacillus sp. V4I5]|uniref:GNAT family N-acetyltransferase n=1 Tax=Paenibacillus sp. V4I5 TaxID=3042306 RepID=UPI0027951BAC|nr:GNAT family N-acetyltransferase [Paenibacillus sp. V4I5]MDQ0916314.1 N-acetylglutamate synthase-like GNAT family acetyltransferase [Paenibacillus sp. V4I5]